MRAFCIGTIVKEPQPYLQRNHNIVNECDMLVAFPSTSNEVLRSGTWSTIRYAKKAKKPVEIINNTRLKKI